MSLYAFITTGLTLTVTAVLECLFIRCTAASPGLYPSRGFKAALLMYRKFLMDRIQRQWTWTINGQYLRALAGMRFPRVGASECDLMFNLVPELASADSQVFWSNGCFTNMLDYGAEHIKLRQLDMPRNFFSGNNCVAEYGHFPSNFLVGVSTAASDIQFRRQMRSRPGEPITVAGNPAVKFASASFEAANKTQRHPDFPLFLTRVFLFDFLTIGILPITEGLIFAILYICLLRAGVHALAIAAIALLFTEVSLVLICVATKKSLVGSKWGADDFGAVLVLATLRLLLRTGLLFCLVQRRSLVLRRDHPVEFHSAIDGMSDRGPNNPGATDAVLRLERGDLRQRLCC